MVNVDYLRAHYETLDDQELERLARTELVPQARTLLEAEMRSRGLASISSGGAAPLGPGLRNPYAAPTSALMDANAWATLRVSGLIRLFQAMVVSATAIGLFIFAWPFLPIPVAEGLMAFRDEAGAGAVSAALSYLIFMVLQPLWILAAFGLCFFKWWARPVFVGTYLLAIIANLLGGLVIWLPWESVLITLATLLDGGVLALAFLPPLSAYFERDRASGRDTDQE